MLWRALSHVEHGFYIDIGAQDPIIDSVSLAFRERGWQGVHVEPIPQYAELLRQQRPGDTVIQAAVGNGPAVLRFFEIPGGGLSTADTSIAEQHRERGIDVREITVPCIPLSSVFDAAAGREIHWLKIDVEGFERQVLSGWGAPTTRPWIVVVESTLPLTQIETHEGWETILIGYDYDPVYFDGLNRYYVSGAHQELKAAFLTPPNVFDGFALNGTSSAPFHKLVEARYQEKISKALAQGEFEKYSADSEIERLRCSVASLERTISEREQELDARLLAIQKQSAQEGTERDREHSEHVQALQRGHAEQIYEAKQNLETLLRTLAQREQELGAQLLAVQTQSAEERTGRDREHTEQLQALQRQHAEQYYQAKQDLETLLRTLAQREQELGAQLLADQKQSAEERSGRDREHSEQLQALQRQHAQQFYQAKQDLETLLRTLAQREQELGAQLLVVQQQATKDAAGQTRQHAEREHALGQQLHSAHQELRRLAQDLESRERAHVEQNSLSRQSLDDLLRTQVQRERDIASLLMETQQRAHKEITIQASNHREQLYALQRELAEREQTLNVELGVREQALRDKDLVSDAAQKRYDEQLKSERATSEARQAALSVLQNELAKIQRSLLFRLSARFRAITNHGSQAVTPEIEHRPEHSRVVRPSTPLADADISFVHESATGHHLSKSTTVTNSQSLRTTMPTPIAKCPDLETLLQYQDRQFVEHAYSALLNRQPDPTGFAYYVNRLRTGVPKVQILGEIFSSAEAKTVGNNIPGLRKALRRQALGRLPVVGFLVRLFVKVDSHSTFENRLRVIEQRAYLIGQQAELHVAQLEHVIKRLPELIEKRTLADPQVVFTNSPATTLDSIEASAAPLAPPSIFSKPIVFEPAPSNEVIQQLAKALTASQEARQLSPDR
jgi:FkbM family methyltransferase